jgi:hypothetical protein
MNIYRRNLIKALFLFSIFPKDRLFAMGAKIPKKDGIYRVRGTVFVNGKKAKEGELVRNGDKIVTQKNSYIIFIIDQSVYKLRPNSILHFKKKQKEETLHILGVIRGGILSTFKPEIKKEIKTRTASIGVRGSAGYVQIENDRTYFCLCYGEAEIRGVNNKLYEKIKTSHHDRPFNIYKDRIEPAKMKDHNDGELVEMENLVARKVPFDVNKGYMSER